MGDPIQKSSTQVVHPHPTTIKKNTRPKCDKGEYLDVDQNGEFVCLLDLGPPELHGSSMTCDPCDIGGTGLIYPKDMELSEIEKRIEKRKKNPPSPPAPQDQFTPGSSTENQVLTRIAEYQCTQTHYTKIFRPYGVEGESEIPSGSEQLSRKTPITIKVVPNESAAETEDRFEKAAEIELRGMLFRKEMSDCGNHRFVRFLSTAQGALKAARN